MRFAYSLLVLGLAACGGPAVCGEDDDGNPYPVCTYEFTVASEDAEADGVIDYCPGDEWGADDGCNSCACDSRGKIVCTSITCPGAE